MCWRGWLIAAPFPPIFLPLLDFFFYDASGFEDTFVNGILPGNHAHVYKTRSRHSLNS